MKTICRIIRNELRMLFSSPISWLILVIFAYQAGVEFCDLFGRQLNNIINGSPTLKLTDQLFTFRSVFAQIQSNLYLYIPLLTMGIMSREYNSGSIKLLYSSPITNAQIIWGKFIALMIYTAALLCVVILMVIFSDIIVKDLDLGAITCGVLGLYLLACAYCAIGLYMSTLTSYQVVAAVGTLAVLAVLNFIGGVGQEIEWVREITYWLCISGRANEMVSGLICSEDVIYFIAVIALFLTLSMMKLKYERGKNSYIKMVIHYLLVTTCVAGIAYFSSRPSLMFYHDMTQTKHRTLSKGSQAVMEAIGKDQKLTITTYVNLLESNYHSADKKNQLTDMKRFEQYRRFNPNIEMKYVYYWAGNENTEWDKHYPNLNWEERAKHLAEAWKLNYEDFLTQDQVKELEDLTSEEFRFVRFIEDEKGQKTALRIFDDMSKHPSETEISAALRRLTTKPTKYSFITGHGERNIFNSSDKDYYLFAKQNGFRHSLINQGFDTDTLTLAYADEIANGADVIVIADPQKPYTAEELGQIEHYIAIGKNFLITGSPKNREFINPILELLGVELTEGTIAKKHEEFASNLMISRFTPQGLKFSGVFAYVDRLGYRITAPNAAGIQQVADKGFHFIPIVATDSTGCWTEKQTIDYVNETAEFNPEKGEVEANGMPIISLLARDITDNRQQKIVIMGSADCISNNEFSKGRNGIRSANYELILQTGLWFSDGKFPVNTNRPERPDNAIFHVKFSQMIWIKAFFMGLIPIILALVGTFIYVRRSRK